MPPLVHANSKIILHNTNLLLFNNVIFVKVKTMTNKHNYYSLLPTI